MTGYLKALCSILGTLLALALIASPSAAQKKKKKPAEDAPAAEAEASGSGSLDSLMETATDKKKKSKKGEEEAAEEEKKAEEGPAEEPVEEPDAWERPPVEEKAPPKEDKAPAAEPTLENPFSAALLLGYGFKTDRATADFGTDPYGFTAGLRGGYTFDFNLYAGLFFNYYLGSSKTGTEAITNTGTQETTASYMHFGAEVGYDVNAGPVLLRPSLEIGMALGFTDKDQGKTKSIGDVMFGPGVTVVHPIDDFFIGGDLRAAIVPGDGVSAVVLTATGGLRF